MIPARDIAKKMIPGTFEQVVRRKDLTALIHATQVNAALWMQREAVKLAHHYETMAGGKYPITEALRAIPLPDDKCKDDTLPQSRRG